MGDPPREPGNRCLCPHGEGRTLSIGSGVQRSSTDIQSPVVVRIISLVTSGTAYANQPVPVSEHASCGLPSRSRQVEAGFQSRTCDNCADVPATCRNQRLRRTGECPVQGRQTMRFSVPPPVERQWKLEWAYSAQKASASSMPSHE